MKKKIFFGVYKFRKILVNAVIVLMLGVISTVAFLGGGTKETSTKKQNLYYYGDKNGKEVSLMINVYWGNEYLNEMLDIMKNKGVKATFFVGGMWAVDNEDFVKKIISNGHEIANHGYKHKSQDKLNEEDATQEIMTTHDIIVKMVGIKMSLFAPPSGAYNDQTLALTESLGYKTIMWTKDTIDWRDHNDDLIYSRATNNINGGDLILVHPTEDTVKALPKIIDTISSKGLKFVAVSENIT